jgi:hypothetical protein
MRPVEKRYSAGWSVLVDIEIMIPVDLQAHWWRVGISPSLPSAACAELITLRHYTCKGAKMDIEGEMPRMM